MKINPNKIIIKPKRQKSRSYAVKITGTDLHTLNQSILEIVTLN